MSACVKAIASVVMLAFTGNVGVAAAEDDDDWLQVRSENFIVVTNAGEKKARELVKELETVRIVFRIALRGGPEGGPPLEVLAAKNDKTLERLLPQTAGDDKWLPSGVFFRTPDKNWIVLDLDARGDNKYTTVYHEYFHALAMPAAPMAPLWFHEGMAGLWENLRINKKDVDVARPSQLYIEILNNVPLMSLRDLVLVDQRSPEYRESDRATIFYAQSWALAHYIFMSDETGTLSRGVGPYIESLRQGADPLTAFSAAFADIDEMETKLRGYLRRIQFNILRMARPPAIEDDALTTESLSTGEYHAKIGSYLAHIGELDDAVPHIESALAANGNDAVARESMGIVEFQRGRYEEALPSFEKAAALDGGRYLTRFYLAMLLAVSATTDGELASARTQLEHAVNANPFHPPSLARLAILYGLAGEQLGLALGMARRAAALSPDAPMSFAALGVAARANGNLDEATVALERALQLSPELELASSQLAEIRAVHEER